jgi:hypothetical protein
VGETSIQLANGDGASFPDPNPGQIFVLTVQHLVEGTMEIMFCTGRTGDVLDVERGQEGTDAVEWVASNNVIVQHRVTADTLEYLAETASGGAAAVVIQLACSDLTTDLATGTSKAYVRAPRAFTLSEIRASLLTASSSGNVAVDVNKNGTTLLYAPVIIDQGEKTSETSASTTIIEDDAIADDDEITIDIVTAGTGAKGLIVTLLGAA